jgi:hypothetical protein
VDDVDDVTVMEARTRAALHRATDGLLVTEEDMDRMEDELMTLLETRPSEGKVARRGRWEWGVAAAAVAALVLGGAALWQVNHEQTAPAAPAPAPAPTWPLVQPELVGLWQNQPDSSWLWEITAEGRIQSSQTAIAYVRDARAVRGENEPMNVAKREGDLYTLAQTGMAGSQDGCDKLRIHLEGPDAATLGNGCPTGDPWVLHLERVSPRTAAAGALSPRFPTGTARTVTVTAELEGTWVNEATRQVLAVAQLSSGAAPLTYVLDDDGDGAVDPDLRGLLTIGSDGSVRPVPGSGTGQGCAPVFTKVVSRTATITTTSGPGGCFPAGSTQTWLRLN